MTERHLPGMPSDRLGVVGPRQLVTVQTLSIARLTAHPIAIVPQTFIAVTGKGPSDSNESGKTSFLAAVALLLGDPEWRVAGTGASSVEALLFEPVTAGAPVDVHAASEGYVVGVFADPDDVKASAHTVWMKIAAGRPYIQVRHAPGLHLAIGSTEQERHTAAASIYRSLGGDPLGSTEYARVLYGRSPRVLAYVASRGRVRSRPSLLKLDAGTFSPEQIGEALVALTGRAALFDRDQQDRRDLAAKQDDLASHIGFDAEQMKHEDEILRQVAARQRLRDLAQEAMRLRRAQLARLVLDAYARSESASVLLAKAVPVRKEIVETLRTTEQKREALRDPAALRATLQKTTNHFSDSNANYEEAVRRDGALRNGLAQIETELSRTRLAAAGHQVDRDGAAALWVERRDQFEAELVVARGHYDDAVSLASALEADLARATDGQFGTAGEYMRMLANQEIPSTSLAAAIRLAPEGRTAWEARLAPWRDAVCVAQAHLTDALEALADWPGALIVSPPDPPEQRGAGELGCRESRLPEGVVDAPVEAEALLWSLADHEFVGAPVPHTVDERSGVRIIGGFDVPVIGQEDLLEHLQRQLDVATERRSALWSRVGSLEKELARATTTTVRAEAAEALLDLLEKQSEQKALVAEHVETLPGLKHTRDEAWQAQDDAKRAVNERERNYNSLSDLVRDTKSRLRTHDAEMSRLKQATVPDDAILAIWGKGREAALRELGWAIEVTQAPDVDRLQEEATAPPLAPGATGMERRRASVLSDAARGHLEEALAFVRQHAEGQGAPPPVLTLAANRYQQSRRSGEEDNGGALFEAALDCLRAWLQEEAERDAGAPEQVCAARASRASKTEYVASQTRQLQQALQETQGAIRQRALSALARIGNALDRLNRTAGGDGAELVPEIIPPAAPDQDWTCRVTPRWCRNPGGPMLPYDNVTNTAQEKLFSIHLVLAALLAAPDARGRVLILDELADSLGSEHRREVLDAIATAAQEHGITILATCQDTIIAEAKSYCREVLYFHYPSKSMPLNRPTRMFGVDRNGARVELIAEALRDGRGLV